MSEHDSFYDLKKPTITNVRAVLKWAHENSIKTNIDYLDCSKSFSRRPSDLDFDEVMQLIKKPSKPFLRVILRKNFNWYSLLTEGEHVEDVLEVGFSGVKLDRNEIFVFCYLKWEFLGRMKEKFELAQL